MAYLQTNIYIYNLCGLLKGTSNDANRMPSKSRLIAFADHWPWRTPRPWRRICFETTERWILWFLECLHFRSAVFQGSIRKIHDFINCFTTDLWADLGVTSRFNKATKFHQDIQYIFPSAHQNCQQLAVPVPISNLIPGDVEQGLEKQWLTHPLQSFHCDSDRTSANRSVLSICSGGMGSKHAPSVHLTLTILYIVDFKHSEHTSPKLVYIYIHKTSHNKLTRYMMQMIRHVFRPT